MYWNEPSLYGANFPYRDFPAVQGTMFGTVPPMWQNVPRFIPPVYGLNQPFFNVPPVQFGQINPSIYPQMTHPFHRQFDVPQMRWDLPLHNFYRPF